jgi:hypothetical protein
MIRSTGLCAISVALLSSPALVAQPPAKPGPEMDYLKKYVGTWDVTMKFSGAETKGTMTYKFELGGMWLASTLEAELFGMKYMGKGMDSYDANKKKYVSTWFDNMSGYVTVMEGNFDAAMKMLTLTGEGPGSGGKMAKMKSTTTMPNDDTIEFVMYEGDAKEPMFTITYKRKK